MAACDVHRPAAVDQLKKLGASIGVDVYERGTDEDPVKIAAWALDEAKRHGKDANNIAPGFRISGLGQLIETGIQSDRLVVFGD